MGISLREVGHEFRFEEVWIGVCLVQPEVGKVFQLQEQCVLKHRNKREQAGMASSENKVLNIVEGLRYGR